MKSRARSNSAFQSTEQYRQRSPSESRSNANAPHNVNRKIKTVLHTAVWLGRVHVPLRRCGGAAFSLSLCTLVPQQCAVNSELPPFGPLPPEARVVPRHPSPARANPGAPTAALCWLSFKLSAPVVTRALPTSTARPLPASQARRWARAAPSPSPTRPRPVHAGGRGAEEPPDSTGLPLYSRPLGLTPGNVLPHFARLAN